MWKRGLVLAVLLVLLTGACGSGSGTEGVASIQGSETGGGSSTTTTTVDPDQAVLDFAQCMRDHGIDMPDPDINASGGGLAFGFTVQGDPGDDAAAAAEMRKMQEADEACRHFLEGIVQEFEQPDLAEMQDQMLAFSECMRDHGIDYPDPVFSENGGVSITGGPGSGFDPSDPDFQAAQEACNEVFGGGGLVISGPIGPGGPSTVEGSSGGVIIGPPPADEGDGG